MLIAAIDGGLLNDELCLSLDCVPELGHRCVLLILRKRADRPGRRLEEFVHLSTDVGARFIELGQCAATTQKALPRSHGVAVWKPCERHHPEVRSARSK